MFNFDKIDLQRFAVSSVGAVALAATCVGAAVMPARAATAPTTIESWQAAVERQLDTRADTYAVAMDSGTKKEAVVAVRFTADGDFAGAKVARSSGSTVLDKHAVTVASNLRYPALPEAMQGRPHTIAMRLVFGRADTAVQYAAMTKDVRQDVKLASSGASNQITAK